MSFIVIDVQGFRTPDFVPKEIAIWDGKRIGHYVFKEPFSFKYLPASLQRQANWLTNNYHRLKWTDGDVELSRIPYILKNIVRYGKTIYCKGTSKREYLRKHFDDDIIINDLEKTQRLRIQSKKQYKCISTDCFYHLNGVCAVENVKLIYDYLLNDGLSTVYEDQRN
jgi:hypothetical protein